MMKGNIYCYFHSTEDKFHYILVYKVGLSEGTHEPAKTCAFGVSLVDSTDIRSVPEDCWKYWKKVD